MTKCMWILQMYILLIFSNLTAAKVNFTLINGLGNLNDYAMECNSSVIIQCKAPANVPLVQWKINYTIELDTGLAARCIVSPCITYNNFSGRYIYTYDASAKVSNLTINPVIAEDSGRKYLCDDGSFPPPFEPTFIVSPSYISTKTNTTYTKDGIEIGVKTGCIFPSDKITFSWYSISGDGVRENYTDSLLSVMECSEKTICFISNGSAQIESFLKIPKAIGIITELREFAVDIVYENINKFTVAVGSYNVTNKGTSSTTTSSTISTTSSTISSSTTLTQQSTPFATSCSTKNSLTTTTALSGNFNEQNSDDTAIIFIASFSTIGGIVFVLLVAGVIIKSRKKRKNISNRPA